MAMRFGHGWASDNVIDAAWVALRDAVEYKIQLIDWM